MTDSRIIVRHRSLAVKSTYDLDKSLDLSGASKQITDLETQKPAPLANRTNEPLPGESFGTEFLDNLAHQMVAPLQSIERQCSNIVKGYVSEDEIGVRLKEVIGHTKILTELARRMRFLNQLVEGSLAGPEQLSFESVSTIWIDGFNNYLPFFKDRDIEVDIDHSKMNRLPNVAASRLAVHQVIMNLYDNALKYGAMSTRIKIFASQEGHVIKNTFQHVAEIKLTQLAASKIFERGFRAVEAQNARAAGTGLGMYISRALMQSMGGNLYAYPTDAKNITRFVLEWRLTK